MQAKLNMQAGMSNRGDASIHSKEKDKKKKIKRTCK